MLKRIAAGLAGIVLVLTGILGTPSAAMASSCGGSTGTACYYYVAGSVTPPTPHTGWYVGMDIAKPTIYTAKGDYHSDAMLEVLNGANIIEYGWNVDPSVNGDLNPHLFFGVYTSTGFQNYNTGMTPTSTTSSTCPGGAPTSSPGATLPYPALKRFGVEHVGTWPSGRWWFAYDTGWVGCVLDTWLVSHGATTSFDTATTFRVYTELASSHDISAGVAPCGESGNGVKGSLGAGPPAALRLANTSWEQAATSFPVLTPYTQGGASSLYDYGALGTSGRSLYVGGKNPLVGTAPC